MATHYDLQEQEQLAQIKHFWSRYGNLITWTLIVVLTAIAAWNGWNYWQRQKALQAAALMDEMERVVASQDLDRIQRVWSDIQAHAASTMQAQHAGLLVAKVATDAAKPDVARQALQTVLGKSKDEALTAVARLRLASIELDQGQLDAAATLLAAPVPAEFEALKSDRLGDLHAMRAQVEEARQAYQKAWTLMAGELEYRRLIEAKLNALGVNPNETSTQESAR